MTDLITAINAVAALVRNIDPRIGYAPFCFHHGGDVSVAFAVESDEALRDLAARFDLPVRVANSASSMWLKAGDDARVSFYGPHHDMPRTDLDQPWSPAHQERQ